MNRDNYIGAKDALAKVRQYCHQKADEARETSRSFEVVNAYENVIHHALDLLSEAMDEWDAGMRKTFNDMRKTFTPDQQ